MAQVIGVRFREVGKVYYFDPLDNKFEKGDHVIVETVRGMECGEVALENSEVSDEEIVKPLKSVVRRATDADLKIVEENRKKEQEAFDICLQKIADHGLDMMKLVNVEYAFDGKKILFYYTSDVRVDFRELVKDLARVFRTRIELRQIGVRDESKMLGGLGMCGRPFCCSTFIGDFQPVSIKMAKEQGLSLNPVKISGTCGRLMCCLKYEQDNYEYLLKITPKGDRGRSQSSLRSAQGQTRPLPRCRTAFVQSPRGEDDKGRQNKGRPLRARGSQGNRINEDIILLLIFLYNVIQ